MLCNPINTKQYCAILDYCFATNKNLDISLVSLISLVSEEKYKYVGCVYCHNNNQEICVNINNSAQRTLRYTIAEQSIAYFGHIKPCEFAHTSGAYYQPHHCVYGFPRNANTLLKINLSDQTVSEIELDLDPFVVNKQNIIYGHHYSGIIWQNYAICPPRLANYILMIDLSDYSCQKIYHPLLTHNHYNGSILHPNGKIYFTPMQGSAVAEFNPESQALTLVGHAIKSCLFGGCIYSDGKIYSFSAGSGLWCIDVDHASVYLITGKTVEGLKIFGSYGSIPGYNGKIYNIPGNSPYFYEYDPVQNVCKVLFTFDDGRYNHAKWAGGALLSNGKIFLTPAFGRFAAEMVFHRPPVLTDEMKNLLFTQYFRPL